MIPLFLSIRTITSSECIQRLKWSVTRDQKHFLPVSQGLGNSSRWNTFKYSAAPSSHDRWTESEECILKLRRFVPPTLREALISHNTALWFSSCDFILTFPLSSGTGVYDEIAWCICFSLACTPFNILPLSWYIVMTDHLKTYLFLYIYYMEQNSE